MNKENPTQSPRKKEKSLEGYRTTYKTILPIYHLIDTTDNQAYNCTTKTYNQSGLIQS